MIPLIIDTTQQLNLPFDRSNKLTTNRSSLSNFFKSIDLFLPLSSWLLHFRVITPFLNITLDISVYVRMYSMCVSMYCMHVFKNIYVYRAPEETVDRILAQYMEYIVSQHTIHSLGRTGDF